jgi:acetylornithine deacetylase
MTLTEMLCQLIAIPSVNPMGLEAVGEIYYESRLSDWLETYLERLGVEHARVEVAPGRCNVLGKYNAHPGAKTILLDAHQDTVPVAGMTIEPFCPRVERGRISGRGAADVKGGMAAMLYAFTRLVRERPPASANVVISFTCDEEATATGIQHLVSRWRDPAAADHWLGKPPEACIVAEPTELNVVVAHKGVLRFRITTQGRACHSSDPSQGVNAIYRMAKVLALLERQADELGDHPAPHPLLGPPTLSVGRIEGGSSVNIVPDSCRIEIDRRLVPGESVMRVMGALQAMIEQEVPEARCEPPWLSCPALASDRNRFMAEKLLKVMAGMGLARSTIAVPFCTHASTVSEAGVPTVVFGPGSIAQAHTADEFIEIEQLEQAAEIYFRFCCESAEEMFR